MYLEGEEKILPKKIGIAQFHRMGLILETEGSHTGRTRRSRRTNEEAQSSANPTTARQSHDNVSGYATLFETLEKQVRDKHPHVISPELVSFYSMLSAQIKDSSDHILKVMHTDFSSMNTQLNTGLMGLDQRIGTIETDIKDIRDQLHMSYKHHDYSSADYPSSSYPPESFPVSEPFSDPLPETTTAIVSLSPPPYSPSPPHFVPFFSPDAAYPAPHLYSMPGVHSLFSAQSPFSSIHSSAFAIQPMTSIPPQEFEAAADSSGELDDADKKGEKEKAKGKGKLKQLKEKLTIRRKK